MTIDVLYLQNGGIEYTAKDFRQSLAAMVTEGVAGSTDLIVNADSPAGLTVLVQPGRAFISGDDNGEFQGVYEFVSDAEVEVDVTSSKPGSGYRVISVYAQVHDDEADSSTFNNGVISYAAGTTVTSGTAVAPTLPDNAILLAQFILRSTTTGITYSTDSSSNALITDSRYGAASRLASTLHVPQTNLVQAESTKTGTSYADPTGGGGGPSVSIVAPPSGMFRIDFSGVLMHSTGTASDEALVSYDIRTGSYSGTVVGDNAGQDHGIKGRQAQYVPFHYTDLRSGLTPGTLYFIRLRYATIGGGTSTFGLRRLTVTPVV